MKCESHNKNTHCIINAGLSLYRYDVTEPPKGGWVQDYKSPIYCWEDAGQKNEIGAFYFFDTEHEAIEVGKNVLYQKEDVIRYHNPELSIWITKAITQDSLYMLDLSQCKNVVELYVTLWHEQINVFRDDFYKFVYPYGSKPLSLIKEYIRYIACHDNEAKTDKRQECEYNIYDFYNTIDESKQLAYACQGLTDFSNGKIFKKLLEEKEFDGYIFQETEANTFCIFNSEKLSFPDVTLILGKVKDNMLANQ